MMQQENMFNKADTQAGNDYIQPLAYLIKLLGVEIIEIQAAITAVGHEPARVERYLRDKLGLA